MSDTVARPTDTVAAARALAVSLGVEAGANCALEAPLFSTVWVVSGGTRSDHLEPFVAVATRDEHSAWVAAADLVGKGGARVDAMPLL